MNDGSSILSGLAAARIASLTSFGTKKWNDCLMQLGDRAARLTVRVAARVHDCRVAMGELHLAAPARTLGGLRRSLDVSGRPPLTSTHRRYHQPPCSPVSLTFWLRVAISMAISTRSAHLAAAVPCFPRAMRP